MVAIAQCKTFAEDVSTVRDDTGEKVQELFEDFLER